MSKESLLKFDRECSPVTGEIEMHTHNNSNGRILASADDYNIIEMEIYRTGHPHNFVSEV